MQSKRIMSLAVLASILVASMAVAQVLPSEKRVSSSVPDQPASSSAPQSSTVLAPKTYGTTYLNYYRIPASEFTPLGSGVSYSDYWYDQPYDLFRRYSTVPNGIFIASPHLPSGATIFSMELDGCNTNGASATIDAFLYDCDSSGDCSVAIPNSVSISAGVGCTQATTTDIMYGVDNHLKQQVVRVFTEAGDNSTTFSGVVIGYFLNVSPSPGSASFNDVPTSHPFFQYIEALKASGITGGCQASPPLYCPDNPLTRGQMAVFLAKALGLQFQ